MVTTTITATKPPVECKDFTKNVLEVCGGLGLQLFSEQRNLNNLRKNFATLLNRGT